MRVRLPLRFTNINLMARYRIRKCRCTRRYFPQWRFLLWPRWFYFREDGSRVFFLTRRGAEEYLDR